eukprot:TRINITY_DN3109_c0_g1_i3.p1 TRINITY_DN3109_c0_g1~~TRINITY_DN3109_c0_g1_i3.p1  ORF type:complete len:186 (+),score=45.80 TRINITY_DN3109_c0_g1_i3:111-668(+)
MHSKIKPVFSTGKLIEDTLQEIIDGVTAIEDIPKIVVIQVPNDPASPEGELDDSWEEQERGGKRGKKRGGKRGRGKGRGPAKEVVVEEFSYYSMNNRRLWLFKRCHELGLLSKVPVRVRQAPTTKRLRDKFNPKRCALVATFMNFSTATDGEKQETTSLGEQEREPMVDEACPDSAEAGEETESK